jgi:hypothetical protein
VYLFSGCVLVIEYARLRFDMEVAAEHKSNLVAFVSLSERL